MRALILLALLLPITTHAVGKDKKLHFGFSAAIGAVAQGYTENVYYSGAICMGVGVAKEAYDEYSYGGWSWGDLLADGIGCGLGIGGIKWIQIYNDRDAYGVGVDIDF